MRYIKNYQDELEVFNALGSEVRLSILNLLLENGRMSMNDIATRLHLTGGAITPHVRKLEHCELIRINPDASEHGNSKFCEPCLDKILFVFSHKTQAHNVHRSHLRAGQYASCEIYPTCGLSTSEAVLGEPDDPRYFFDSRHFNADIIWFTKGYVEYMIPCVIPYDSHVEQLSISAELSSEAPGSNPFWPSDIHFYINGIPLGMWTSPGDYADKPGLFTPSWWFPNWNQYGLLKTLTIRETGTFMDDQKISDIRISQLHLSADKAILFRMAVPETARHPGGLTVFGRGFGNYNQDIEFRITYSK